jgi:hypothetical protein
MAGARKPEITDPRIDKALYQEGQLAYNDTVLIDLH